MALDQLDLRQRADGAVKGDDQAADAIDLLCGYVGKAGVPGRFPCRRLRAELVVDREQRGTHGIAQPFGGHDLARADALVEPKAVEVDGRIPVGRDLALGRGDRGGNDRAEAFAAGDGTEAAHAAPIAARMAQAAAMKVSRPNRATRVR